MTLYVNQIMLVLLMYSIRRIFRGHNCVFKIYYIVLYIYIYVCVQCVFNNTTKLPIAFQ